MTSPFYAKGDPGAPIDNVTQDDRTMTFWVQGHAVGSVDLPPYNPVIVHGDDPDVPRMEGIGSSIIWIGSVEPNNAAMGDIWGDVSGQKPEITTTVLNGFYVDAPFNMMIHATGTTPMEWGLAEGSGPLPPNINLSGDGNLYGTPSATGHYDFVIRASSGFGADEQPYSIDVGDPIAPSIGDTELGDVFEGIEFTKAIRVTGSLPIHWEVDDSYGDGQLPGGLVLNPDTGEITGVPTTIDSYNFKLIATNHAVSGYDEQIFTGDVSGVGPTITTVSLDPIYQGEPYSKTLTASGSEPKTWSILSGTLPAGLTRSGAVISGTPTGTGPYGPIRINAHNAYPPDNYKDFSGNVISGIPVVTGPASLGNLWRNFAITPISATATGPGSITWDDPTALPAGLSINGAGLITGTPTTVTSSYASVIRASNAYGGGTAPLTGQVKESTPVVTETSMNAMTIGVPFSQQLHATGGPTLTWSKTAGSWPPGSPAFAVSSSGLVTGTPTTAGSYNVTITATNGVESDPQPFTLPVSGAGVEYRAGSAVYGSGTSVTTKSVTVAASAGDTIIFGTYGAPATITYSNGGDAAELVAAIANGGISSYGQNYLYKVANVGGAGNLTITSGAASTLIIEAAAYANVGSITGITTPAGVGTSISVSATNVTNGVVVAHFGAYLGINSVSSSTGGTSRAGTLMDGNASGTNTFTGACTFTQNSGIVAVLNPA